MRMLFWLGQLLAQIARPYRCDEGLPPEVQASLSLLGVPCDTSTSRADLVAFLWARKRTMLGTTPPRAA
ncbi:MAG TPA: hypothetical protein VJP81_07775 [Candidatus Dormibacteraeota bacterium]|nr:hypothetical protein [Candidatus Dormibacteraeota bacterium]